MEDYYAILGLDSAASPESIKVAYRRLARETHPDRKIHSSEAEKATLSLRMAQLNEAYAVLSDGKRRREYDEKLHVQEILIRKDSSAAGKTGAGAKPSKGPPIRIQPRSEVISTIVGGFSRHLRARFLARREGFAWRERDLEGFDWALEALFWTSHYCVALRGFTAVDSATARKLINYSEIAILRRRRYVRKSYFLFLLPFQRLSEWELISVQCQRFVTEESRSKFSGTPAVILLLDMEHGRTLRFATKVRDKRLEQLLQWIGTPS